MKEIIEQLKERKIDVKLQRVVDFAKVTGLNNTKCYDEALKSTFLDMIENEGDEFESEVMGYAIDKGLEVLLKEMNIEPSKGVETDSEIKALFSGLEKLKDLLMKGE